MRTKQSHVSKAKDAVVAALNVITPGDAGHLWEALKASNSVEKALQISEECPADKRYLEALAETYLQAGIPVDRYFQSWLISLPSNKSSATYQALPSTGSRWRGCTD